MPRRHPDSRAQQAAPKRLPGEGARRRRDPLLPGWAPCAPPPAVGAGRPEVWRARGGPDWWQASGGESLPRMPPLPAAAQRAARRSGLRSLLLLPPRFLDRAPWTRVAPAPEPGGHGKDPRGAAREAKDPKDSLGALLGQLLPTRFQKFLCQLGAQCGEQLEPQRRACHCPSCGKKETEAQGHRAEKAFERAVPKQRPVTISDSWLPAASEPRPPRGVSEPWWGQLPSSPSRSFLPNLRCQSSNPQNSLKKDSSHRIPTLGPLRRDCPQFTEVKKANNPCDLQAPKLKAALIRSSSEEASGHNRRCSPFRVRFADETVQDTAFRYWERRCAHLEEEVSRKIQKIPSLLGRLAPPVQQGITRNPPAQPAPSSATLEPVFGSIRRWLENLPKTLDSKPQTGATTGTRDSWDCPSLPNLGRRSHLSEDTCSSSTQRWRRDHGAFLGTHDILDPVGRSPCSWSQKLESFLPHLELKRGGPKGYQLLLPSALQ